MKTAPLWGLPLLLFATQAHAHFRLEQPADALQGGGTGTGTPSNGDQKTSPCGQGTGSGLVTQARAGATLHVKVVETVPHGGHYRIAFASNRATLVDPVVTGTCGSAAIQGTPTLPVLADGVFPHTQAQAAPNTPYETDVTLPNVAPGRYTLQVLEFMTPHAAPCFYYHCASVEIVAPDAGIPDGGVVVVDAGAPPDASTPSVDSGPGGAPSPVGDAAAPAAPQTLSTPADGDGCSAGSADAGGLAVPALAALVALGAARRRRGAPRVR